MPDYRFYKIGDDGHVVSLRVERTFDDGPPLLMRSSWPTLKQSRFGRESEWSIVFASPQALQMWRLDFLAICSRFVLMK
jgi:hypothetical protein